MEREDNRKKYILLHDRVGSKVEKGLFINSSTPIQVLRGELLEALPEAEQPTNPHQVAAASVERKTLRLECPTSDLARLTDEETELLLPVTSAGERHRIYHERDRLDAGRRLTEGSHVLVKVKGLSKDVPGVVWYKGSIETSSGTMFGVELRDRIEYGTTDGIFRNKRYFTCPPDSGVFISLDKLTVRDIESNTSPKKSEDSKGKLAIWKDKLSEHVPGALWSKTEGAEKKGLKEVDHMKCPLKLDEKVIVVLENDKTVRGSVRYVGGAKDKQGHWYILTGVELEERQGDGTGIFQGKQLFVCKMGFAKFVPANTVIPVGEFENKTVKGGTEDDPPYNTRNKFKLKAEAGNHSDKAPRSMSFIDKNRPRTGASRTSQSFRRTSSSSTDDMDIIRSADLGMNSDGSNKDKIVEDQRRILDEIKKNQWEKVDKKDVPQEANLPSMHEDHYSNSGGKPITVQPGRSQFYSDKGAGLDMEFKSGVTKRDPPISDQNSMCLARGTTNGLPIGPTDKCSSNELALSKKRPQTNINGDAVVDCVNSSGSTARDLFVRRNSENKPPLCESSLEGFPPHVSDNAASQPCEAQHSRTEAMAIGLGLYHRHGLEVGSMVEIPLIDGQQPRYGVIRWIGFLSQVQDKLVAGVELELEQPACSDGSFGGKRYFTCPPGRGFFVLLQNCRQDSRFAPESPLDTSYHSDKAFGTTPSPVVKGICAPPEALKHEMCGNMRGIQGHHNSCYLDSTLYSMFAFTLVFDSLLHRDKKEDDLKEYDEVQMVLKDMIVNPLRKNGYVRADRVLQLRRLLDQLGTTSGLVNEEKDPEEFLNTIFHQVFKVEPYLQLRSQNRTEGAHFYQLIIEKDDTIKVPSIQQLLRRSFFSADIKLAEVPSCLILFMPRFGSKYKMYDMIQPNLTLDVTDIVESVPSRCYLCGINAARSECKDCLYHSDKEGIYCDDCNVRFHRHPDRKEHKRKPIPAPRNYPAGENPVQNHVMELFAVVSIATSHYVSFVKCGPAQDASWCFFDSMADRKGEQNGYNIPSVTPCPEAGEWLSADLKHIIAANENGEIPEKVRRLLGDAYLCMYQNTEMIMYK